MSRPINAAILVGLALGMDPSLLVPTVRVRPERTPEDVAERIAKAEAKRERRAKRATLINKEPRP